MVQRTAPFNDVNYGWDMGESGWNIGMDENLIKFSFLFDRNINGVVSRVPEIPVEGSSYYSTQDKLVYYVVGGTYYSTKLPSGFQLIDKSSNSLVEITPDGGVVYLPKIGELSNEVESINDVVNSLGTAAQEDIDFFATSEDLDLLQNNILDDLASTDISKGISLVNGSVRIVNTISDLKSTPIGNQPVFVLNYAVEGDGGGGLYIPNPQDSTTVADGGTIISTNSGSGRWFLKYSPLTLRLEQMGAKPGTDCSSQLQSAIVALYNKFGGGTLNFSRVFRFDSPIQLYPNVILKGSGQQSSALEYYGPANSIAITTIRPTGYQSPIAVSPGIQDTSLNRRNGTIFDNTIGLDLNLVKFAKIKNVYFALWDRAITHNATNSNRGLLAFNLSQQDFWNEITSCEITSCRYGQTYYGAANRNTCGNNTYTNVSVCHDFSNQYNTAETNYYYQENYEGCSEWALWKSDAEPFIYTQTWVQCTFENPSSNSFIGYFRDPGHQVFVNLSLIPPNNPSVVSLVQMYPGISSTYLGTGTSDRLSNIGFRIPEVMKIYKVPQLGSNVVRSGVYSGSIAAQSFVTFDINFPGAVVNDIVTASALRSLSGCSISQAFVSSSGVVSVVISNSTAAAKTISPVEIVVKLARTM